LLVAAVAALALELRGTPEVRIAGVPDYWGLKPAAKSEAKLTKEEAIERAIAEGHLPSDATARQVVLVREHVGYPGPAGERLVWIVNFADPDDFGPVFISGPIGSDHSCDWAFHYAYVVAKIDAETGEWLSQGSGAFFDPSLPPTYESEGSSDRAYCEQLQREWDAAARSP
jgi:hypothetical protein